MKIIQNYFPSLTGNQVNQFEALFDLYSEWNEKINVISRKDIQNLYLHHVLHSLAIAKFVNFAPHSRVLDVGTGGGFPGIPLAIFFPEQEFVMIDSIGKKIKVVNEVAQAISLTNVEATHRRVQDEKRKYDFVVSRAVMSISELVKLVRKNISPTHNNALNNGLICLKGGDLADELKPFKNIAESFPLTDYFSEPFFETKKLVYLPII
ncbi:MAG TPA: 16S rRNA (guanine(527)-N(7))-methyltransferase RsmG [Dysgonamonadaceae bacterium]|nr:16S rRNA (guanine(527)-N(7))-methyltransferase RsmG [Dysgonamonadaceae bacterium]